MEQRRDGDGQKRSREDETLRLRDKVAAGGLVGLRGTWRAVKEVYER